MRAGVFTFTPPLLVATLRFAQLRYWTAGLLGSCDCRRWLPVQQVAI